MTRRCSMTATGLVPLPFNKDRNYLMVVASTNVTVTIGDGNAFIIPAGQAWEPDMVPMNDMTFIGTGTIVEG